MKLQLYKYKDLSKKSTLYQSFIQLIGRSSGIKLNCDPVIPANSAILNIIRTFVL